MRLGVNVGGLALVAVRRGVVADGSGSLSGRAVDGDERRLERGVFDVRKWGF